MIKNQKGFTLIELLVVVLIIGILAAMAMPQYFKAVERSRMTEAVTLLGNIAQAEQRKYMQVNKFTANYGALDVAPKGATGSLYYTKGTSSAPGNGFGVTLNGSGTTAYNAGYTEAIRTNGTAGLQYTYTLKRFYASSDTNCKPTGNATDDSYKNAAMLCADFCGVDTVGSDGCCSNGAADANGQGTACTAPSAQ